ncbi:MAG: hypothetical protein HDQ88_04465 [Clostridia bacterium]|nr:hypothetical protein [Clostridia bacterium]
MYTTDYLIEMKTEIGILLRDAREELGYHLDYVSDHSGRSVFLILAVEYGLCDCLTEDVLHDICNVYGKTVGMLVSDACVMRQAPLAFDYLRAFVDSTKGLSDEELVCRLFVLSERIALKSMDVEDWTPESRMRAMGAMLSGMKSLACP